MQRLIYVSFFLCSFLFANAQDCNYDCVYPGDANHDGIVDYIDIMYIYRHQGLEGMPRTEMGTDWNAREAIDWGFEYPLSQVNAKHADSNGDGLITVEDRLAVFSNLYQTHQGYEGNSGQFIAGNDLTFLLSQDTVGLGDTLEVSIYLGSESDPIEDLSGLSFEIELDTSVLREESLVLPFAIEGWVGDFSNSLASIKYDFANPIFPKDEIGFALSRTDGTVVTGHGEIFEFSIIIEDNISGLMAGDQLPEIFKFKNILGQNRHEVNLQLTAQNTGLWVEGLSPNAFAVEPCNELPLRDEYIQDYYDLNQQIWINNSRTTYTYTTFGAIESKTKEYRINELWFPKNKEEYFYDSDEKRESIVYSQWNSDLIDWEPQHQNQFVYNNDKLSKVFKNLWVSGQWESYKMEDYNYDNDLLSDVLTLRWYAAQNTWVNTYQTEYHWTMEHQESYIIDKFWHPEQNSWVNLRRDTFLYNDTELYQHQQFLWDFDSNDWTINWQDEFANNQTERRYWNTPQSSLDLAFREMHEHNGLYDICQLEFYHTTDWENLFRWQALTTSINEEVELAFDCSFPNPFPSGHTFSCQSESKIQAVQVYNINGQLMQMIQINSDHISVNIDLPQGAYILTFIKDNQLAHKEKLLIID